ncbi:MAG: TIGR03905 family TSCPD domain-containing protein [Spirochaetales bacterium]|nr:TIGR03905 family TSCPD domain-containing protein [Spirochaetales bacterium]
MKEIDFTPSGICARNIKITLDDENRVQDLRFVGGCDGNHKGLNALIKGMKAEEAIERLSGITCGFRTTSCPDQVAVALRQANIQ